ncbi:hypothetical protein [Streptomyces sp. NPDC085932]|uniref:hypothetical protein n=1 Tax=Streptomyces sp. NPDC085932 TaxID=3365741 RepID=UPI0037D62703
MADEQYRWLDRETAERLLSGEPPEAVDGAHRGEAERLARTLGALSAPPPPTSEELPGEAAAVAAFRKAREERADAADTFTTPHGPAAGQTADAGLVRIGTARGSGRSVLRRSRRLRPAGLALAASLTVGMVGGVAAVAGTGVLGTPFGGDGSGPGASVSASVTPPERPLVSPSPTDAGPGGAAPGDDAPNSAATGGTGDAGGEGTHEDTAGKPGTGADRPEGHEEITEACRDLRAGKRLDDDRRRALRDAADGMRVWKYCKGVLALGGSGGRDDEGKGKDKNEGKSKGHGQGGHKYRDRDTDPDPDRGHGSGREQDAAERKAERKAEREAERKAGRKAGKRAGAKQADTEVHADSDRAGPSAPLRPAVSYSVKIVWPRV